jgi:hypothetical protein
MKHAAVEDIIASFPHQILLTVQGGPDYQTTHAIRKLLHVNAWAIDTHLGGGALGHLGIIVSVAAYTVVATTHPWSNPAPPGVIAAGTVAQISAARHLSEENINTFRTYRTVEQSLKKQIITIFNPCIWKF